MVRELTDDGDFNFRSVLAVSVRSNNFINSSVLSFGRVVEELGVVRNIVNVTMWCLSDSFVVLVPHDIGSRFTANFNIDVDGFAFLHGQIVQSAAINLWSH